MNELDFRLLSLAVQHWYRHYNVAPTDHATDTLCAAAMNFLREGCRTVEEIAQKLVETYAGLPAIKVNAPSSCSIH